MKIVTRLLLIAVLSAPITACEKWSWPPYEKSLRELFEENKELFEEIRQNMLADNLEEADWALARGKAPYDCEGPGCPLTISRHDEQLQAKYSKLIEERSIFRYTLRDGDFNVRLSFPPMRSGDFYFNFIQTEAELSMPHCDEGRARLPSCGRCYEDLDSTWYMYWFWYPKDLGPDWDGSVGEGLPTPEEIQEQTEIATNECLEAGWVEMGMEIDAN